MDSTRSHPMSPLSSERIERSSQRSSWWGAPFVSGVLIAIVGFIAFWSPVITGIASAVFIGTLLAISGAIEMIGAFRNRGDRSAALPFLSGILSLVVGVLFITQPLLGVAALGLLLAAYFFTTGLFRGITSIADRYPRWGWDFAYGLIAIAAGVVLLLNWPVSTLFVVGLLVGIELISRGAALMAISWEMRRSLRRFTA